jgi:hypothetical protein
MKEALDYMRRGALVPDSTVWEMERERSGVCDAAAALFWTASDEHWRRLSL